jgi:glutamate 5-kinase
MSWSGQSMPRSRRKNARSADRRTLASPGERPPSRNLSMTDALRQARRIVVKVGSSLVTNEGRGLDADAIGQWCRQMAALSTQGRELVMVSSGAVAEGMARLGWTSRPRELHELQAAAAVGQMGLAQMYESQLRQFQVRSAQVLLTHADLADRERYLNARSTLLTLLGLGVIPVINENDTVVNDEIRFGDNDTLGALVANLVEADALVILTDQVGLFTADPRKDPTARLVERAVPGDPQLERMASGGREQDVLLRLASGEAIGTALIAGTGKLAARKQWMADHLQMRGAVVVDDGAVTKVHNEGKSLLPIGVIQVQGDFRRGDVIAVRTLAGQEVARGLANYSSSEARLIARKPSSQIEALLGYMNEPELIHRTNLVLS